MSSESKSALILAKRSSTSCMSPTLAQVETVAPRISIFSQIFSNGTYMRFREWPPHPKWPDPRRRRLSA